MLLTMAANATKYSTFEVQYGISTSTRTTAISVVTCKIKSFAKILAAVDDRREIILLQRVENVPKTSFRKSRRGHLSIVLLFTSVYMLIIISRESRARCDSLQQTQLTHIFQHDRKR